MAGESLGCFAIDYGGAGMPNLALCSAVFPDVLPTRQIKSGHCLYYLLVQRGTPGTGGQHFKFAQKLEFSCEGSRHLFCLDYVPVYQHREVFERPKN